MKFDVLLAGGDADGAYFSGHALPWPPPETIQVAVGGENVALLDLPDDQLELGERMVEYRLARDRGGTFICGRGRGRGCGYVLTYRG